MKAWRRLGEILVSEGFLTEAQISASLEVAQEGVRIGEHLVRGGLISETQLAQALAHQLSLPWVSIVHVDFRPDVIERIPAEMAMRLRLIPVYVQQARGQEPVLFVAMADPTNDDGLREAGKQAGLAIRAMVTAQTDLLHAIRFHYGLGEKKPEGGDKKPEAKAEPDRKSEPKPGPVSKHQAPPLPMRAKMPSISTEWRPQKPEPAKGDPGKPEGAARLPSVEVELDLPKEPKKES